MTFAKLFKTAADQLEAGEGAYCVATFTEALGLRPDDFQCLLHRGDAQWKLLRKAKPALQDYQAAAIANPISPRPHVAMAELYREKKQFELAHHHIDLAIEKEKGNPDSWNAKAMISFSEKQYEHALTEYSKAIALCTSRFPSKNKAIYLANQAEVFVLLRQFDNADESLMKALKFDKKLAFIGEVQLLLDKARRKAR
jgi:tetratricopeptide (TPR) repeat protein